MKKRFLSVALAAAVAMSATACTSNPAESKTTAAPAETKAEETTAAEASSEGEKKEAAADGDLITVGYAQVGAESDWRTANTESFKSTFTEENGYKLIFDDAQQKQENQIKAIKSFIDMGVDVIGLAPVVETGWDAVFTEAKDAGIPIILVDRMADVPEDLYATFIGSDFIEEGKNAADEMAKLIGNSGKIVQLEGTVGASSANDRKKGFEDQMAAEYPDIEIIASQTGDFTRAKGKEVMESFLKTYGSEIKGVYAHNDDMMLGAIEAIKEAGLKPGEDIKTVSCDGVKAIFEAMVAGEANVTVECNPLLGPVFFETAQKLANGETVEKWIKSEEGIFRQETAAEDIKTRVY